MLSAGSLLPRRYQSRERRRLSCNKCNDSDNFLAPDLYHNMIHKTVIQCKVLLDIQNVVLGTVGVSVCHSGHGDGILPLININMIINII